MTEPTPQDDTYTLAQFAAMARTMRQVYIALTKEGFTPAEALDICKALLPRTGAP